MNPQQAAEFAQALADIGGTLDNAEQRKKWLDEMKSLVAENKAAVRLLGSPQEIERHLVDAERRNDAAKSVLDEAQDEAEKLEAEGKARLDQRENALDTREQDLIAKAAAQQSNIDSVEAEFRKRREALDTAERVLEGRQKTSDERGLDLKRREGAIKARENEADTAMAEAKRLTEGMAAVIGAVAN